VQSLLDRVQSSPHPFLKKELVEVCALLFLRVVDIAGVDTLIQRNLSGEQIEMLHVALGPAYPVMTNSLCGHYQLNLRNTFDRIALMKLAEHNSMEVAATVELSKWDKRHGGTAHLSDWSNFRNAKLNGASLPSGWTNTFFHHALLDRAEGILDFDYASTARPKKGTAAMKMSSFFNLSHALGLPMSRTDKKLYATIPESADGKSSARLAASILEAPELETVHRVRDDEAADKAADDPLVRPFTSKSVEADGNLRQWLTDHGCNVAGVTDAVMAALQEQVAAKTCEYYVDDKTKKVRRVVHAMHCRVRHADEPMTLVTTEGINLGETVSNIGKAGAAPETKKKGVKKLAAMTRSASRRSQSSFVLDEPVTWHCEVMRIEKDQPVWPAEFLAKQFVAARLAGIGLIKKDISTATARASIVSGASPFAPLRALPEGLVETVCTHHYYDVFVRHVAAENLSKALLSSTKNLDVKASRQSTESLFAFGAEQRDTLTGQTWKWVRVHDAGGVPPVTHPPSFVLDQVRRCTGTRWLACHQVMVLVSMLSRACLNSDEHTDDEPTPRAPPGHGAAPHPVADEDAAAAEEAAVAQRTLARAARRDAKRLKTLEDLIVHLFSRTVDLDHFHLVLKLVPRAQVDRIASRLGWLNIVDPMSINHAYDLDLRAPDQWRVANLLATVAFKEDGKTSFRGARYRRKSPQDPKYNDPHYPWIAGWGLPANWDTRYSGNLPAGVPHDGHLILEGFKSHKVNAAVRQEMREAFCLIGIGQPEAELIDLERARHDKGGGC